MRILGFGLLLIFLSVEIAAQSDALTSVKIFARDAADKPIEGVGFRVLQVIDEKREPHDQVDVYPKKGAKVVHLGLEARGTFLFQLNAKGFDPTEFKVFFSRGHMQTVVARLKRTGSSEIARIDRLTSLSGQVLDYTGSLITNAKVVAVDERGLRFETTSSPNGYYELNLPFNAFFWDSKLKQWIGDASEPSKYDLSITAQGFKIFEIKQLLLANGARGNLDLDIVLGLLDKSAGGATILR